MWTDEQIEGLKDGCADGLTFSAISKLIGMSRNACIGKASRMGLTNGRSPDGGSNRRTPVRKAKPVTLVERIDAAPVVAVDPVHIEALTAHACRWPLWRHEDEPSMMFCGAPVVEGCVYCGPHCRVAYSAARVG